MRIKKIIRWSIAVIALALIVFAAITGYGYYIVKIKQVTLEETAYIYITPADNAQSVMLKIKAVTGNAPTDGFEMLANHNNFNSRRRSGKFAIKNGDSMYDIYRRIVSNEQTPVRVTVPSTRTIPQLVGTVCRQLMMDSVELSEFTTHSIYLSKIGYDATTLPSLFIPDTYEVYWNIKPERLMIKFMEEHTRFWNKQRTAKAEKIGLTPEQVATLASIVDEETNNNEEKPIVAGLYINRLKRGMPLQADPTVKYAIGDPTRRRILNSDLAVESPYNTYKHIGLPPGPIRIPTKQALESVLNYQKHDYLYMCAKEDFSGRHNFAKSLSEHNANARRYQEALSKRGIKR